MFGDQTFAQLRTGLRQAAYTCWIQLALVYGNLEITPGAKTFCCSLVARGRQLERERERQTDRQTDRETETEIQRQRQRERDTEGKMQVIIYK